ncbi:DEAD-box ATP-dependent RNA helicase CshA [Paraliobacillus sp. PM-2]|uniref:DEAD/DEAH box helicase n=1 Tax=Paraliobacillus sp. PM-2 TaxID=1462524 RepID=UPI00061BD51F|nr:DEAD/DEAH box helicase [Paraliobacillus sp. PM-2]CQR46345.1 DEAD-box ATP-dependent RNA helicase CshA [Paraliobacillus sp. PM-2]
MFVDTLQPFLQQAWKGSGFSEPTMIQEKAYPIIKEGKDVIGISPTGSGKTIAYLLPLLEEIDVDQKQTQLLILASSHELVAQIHRLIQEWTAHAEVTSMMMIGGANIKRQIEKLKKKPQIVVGTPGRVLELIKQKKFKVHALRSIVLDEADQLLVPEHRNDLFGIIKAAPKQRQLLMFSATIAQGLAEEANRFMVTPEVIRVNSEEAGTPEVSYQYITCDERDKIDILRSMARNLNEQMLVFFRDSGNLSVVAEKLAYKGMHVEALHGNLTKQKREKAIRQFTKGEVQLLLATDVAARGLDVKDLGYVIQMDVPKEADHYLHRAGRTGRIGSDGGVVVSLVTQSELRQLKQTAKALTIKLEEKVLRKGKLM